MERDELERRSDSKDEPGSRLLHTAHFPIVTMSSYEAISEMREVRGIRKEP